MNDPFPKCLPVLPYAYDALEPILSKKPLTIHHDKLMAGACDRLNAALKPFPRYQSWSVEHLLGECGQLPFALQTAVRQNAGSLYSHELYFDGMTPHPTLRAPQEQLGAEIDRAFGCFEHLWTILLQTGIDHFGDGWLWLAWSPQGGLRVLSTRGHDTPLLRGLRPILVADLWEHAYYLDYQSRRADYLSGWGQRIDWQFAEQNFLFITNGN